MVLNVFDFSYITLFSGILDGCVETFFVDGAEAGGRDGEGDPCLLLNPEELLVEEVNVEFTLGAALRVRNVVADHGLFACDLTNL